MNQKRIHSQVHEQITEILLSKHILKSQCWFCFFFLAETQNILGIKSAMCSCTTKTTVIGSRLIILLVHKGYSRVIFIITHEVLKN